MMHTDFPMYLYHHEELPRRGDGALFHYTSLKSFLIILEDMTLLPSFFGKLNDMNEGNVSNMNMNEIFLVMYNAEKYINEHCHMLSFLRITMNMDSVRRGQAIQRCGLTMPKTREVYV